MEDWLTWCRLCSTEGVSTDALMCLGNNLIDFLKQYLSVDLFTGDDKVPIAVCANCLKFTIKLESYSKHFIKVDKMFTYLVTAWKNGLKCENLTDIRFEYGIELDDLQNGQLKTQNCDYEDNDINVSHDVVNSQSPEIDDPTDFKPIRHRKRKIFDLEKNSQNGEMRKNSRKNIKIQAAECNISELLKDSDDQTTLKIYNKNNKSTGIFPCPICSQSFRNGLVRSNHLKKQHGNVELPYKCNECPKAFPEAFKLRLHKIIHLPDNEKPVHQCRNCDKSFCRTETLYNHVQRVHLNNRKYTCEECGKSFHTNYRLKEHYFTHSEDRSVQCSFCTKKFKNDRHLKMHEDIHSATSYECTICSKILNTKKSLNTHYKVHSDEKQFKCHLCNNDYKRMKALKRHIKINHLGEK